VSQETANRTFDELARAMAEGSLSRRRVLKLFAGTALAALIPSRALADDDDDCVRVCHVPFDRETEECDFANAETRCVSRSRRRRHLENHPCDCRGRCANCLPMCLPNGEACTSGTQCCSGNCDSGFCVPAPTGPLRSTCLCTDQTEISLCTSLVCSDDALHQVCISLCASHGGWAGQVRCAPPGPPCSPPT
jgi:hypothetical protein